MSRNYESVWDTTSDSLVSKSKFIINTFSIKISNLELKTKQVRESNIDKSFEFQKTPS